ncbi:MAG: phosphate ABC transporter substrate-binding protein PstS family protein [Dehalococcoidia bacterium]|nr:phosphate ABC transporter substrate-binding protein PstS family protein [Dehalococcoidia bacterium]
MLTKLRRRGRAGLLVLGSLLVIGSLVGAAACGDDDDDDEDVTQEEATEEEATEATEEATEPAGDETEEAAEPEAGGGGEIDYGSLSGSITIDGSSTVFPITQAVAEEFASDASGVQVDVSFAGSGAGFERLCALEIEIADASRPIEDDEVTACADAGLDDLIEIQVGIDALTVVTNPANPIECVTVQELYDLFTDGGATQFADVNPDFPAEDVVFYYPGTDSGTFDFFVEVILEAVDGDAAAHRGDGTASEDDNVLSLGVEEDANSIGYFGFAYFQGAGDSLKALEVDGGDGCVPPSSETALDNSYYLSRPLFIYTSASYLEENPHIVGFLQYYLDNLETLVPEVGYVNLPDDTLAEQQSKIDPYLP